jgi:hypothetical protein
MKRKARKMMYNENGVAFAPWISKQINEEVSYTTNLVIIYLIFFQVLRKFET